MTDTKKKVVYLKNKDLLAEVIRCRENPNSAGEYVMSDELARMLQLLCSRYGRKGNVVGYSYNDDMQAYAMLMLVKTWRGFNPEKSSNPFAFYTQCIKNSFTQYLKYEKKHRKLRDKMLINEGLSPSFGYEDLEVVDATPDDSTDYLEAVKMADGVMKKQKAKPVIQVELDEEPEDPTIVEIQNENDDNDEELEI